MTQEEIENQIINLPNDSLELFEFLISESTKLNWIDSKIAFKYLLSAIKLDIEGKMNS